MGSINKSLYNSLIIYSRKSDFVDKALSCRVFEQTHHHIPEINNINFTSYNAENEIKLANSYADANPLTNTQAFSDLYFVLVSSFVYIKLMNDIKIPTLNFQDNEEKYYKCTLLLSDKCNEQNKLKFLIFLSFLNLPLDEDVLISCEVYNHLKQLFTDSVDIKVLNEISLHTKKIVLDTLPNDYEQLSTVNQINYRRTVNTILNYKNLNSDTKHDPSRLDNLQYYLIDQQLRFILYSIFNPILTKNPVKFRRMESIYDQTGNLFFNIEYPNEVNDDFYSLSQISEYVTNEGFFISYLDANGKTHFNKNLEPSTSINLESTIGHQNTKSIYPLLFRLCDSELSEFEDQINTLVSDARYDELFLTLEKMLT